MPCFWIPLAGSAEMLDPEAVPLQGTIFGSD